MELWENPYQLKNVIRHTIWGKNVSSSYIFLLLPQTKLSPGMKLRAQERDCTPRGWGASDARARRGCHKADGSACPPVSRGAGNKYLLIALLFIHSWCGTGRGGGRGGQIISTEVAALFSYSLVSAPKTKLPYLWPREHNGETVY